MSWTWLDDGDEGRPEPRRYCSDRQRGDNPGGRRLWGLGCGASGAAGTERSAGGIYGCFAISETTPNEPTYWPSSS